MMTYQMSALWNLRTGFPSYFSISQYLAASCLYKNVLVMAEFLQAPFLVLHFSSYTLTILLSMLMIFICPQLYLWLLQSQKLPLLLLYSTLNVSGFWFVVTARFCIWSRISPSKYCGIKCDVACKNQFVSFI